MKTLEEIKEEVAISRGHNNWQSFLNHCKSYGTEIGLDALDLINSHVAGLYADQFKPKWIPIPDDIKPGRYFVFDGNGYCSHREGVARLNERGMWFDYDTADQIYPEYYMPLPSAPERKEEGV